MKRAPAEQHWASGIKRKALGIGTWAMMRGIGIHPALLLERRDATLGQCGYLRDACDAGTSMLIVPEHVMISEHNLRWRSGHRLSLDTFGEFPYPEDDPISGLVGVPPRMWIPLCWRLALEFSGKESSWWGWTGSLPTAQEMAQDRARLMQEMKAAHTEEFTRLLTVEQKVSASIHSIWELLRNQPGVFCPPEAQFERACRLLLRRSIAVPSEFDEEGNAASVDLVFAPYIDTLRHNVDPNAAVEVLLRKELPDWYAADSWLDASEALSQGTSSPDEFKHPMMVDREPNQDEQKYEAVTRKKEEQRKKLFVQEASRARFYREQNVFFAVTLLEDSAAGSEVTVRYQCPYDEGSSEALLHHCVRYHAFPN